MTEAETKILPNPSIVQIREDFSREWLRTNRIDRVMGQYAYDAAKQVHCCEITPSYELTFIRYEAVYAEGYEPDDEARERIEVELAEATAIDQGIIYIHCRSVDAIAEVAELSDIPTGEPWRMAWNKEDERHDRDDSDEQVEEVREYFNCNHH